MKSIVFFCFFCLTFQAALSAQELQSIDVLRNRDCSVFVSDPSVLGSAKKLNALGMEKYYAGHMSDAASLFYCAVKADERFTLAHYNLACVLSILRKDLHYCVSVYLDEIELHLTRSIELDRGRRQRMLKDSDLANLREFPFFKRLSVSDSMSPGEILTFIDTWYGPSHGVLPASPEYVFRKDKTVHIRHYSADTGWEESTGTFTSSGNSVTVYPEGRDPRAGTLFVRFEKGICLEIRIEFSDGSRLGVDPDRCSA